MTTDIYALVIIRRYKHIGQTVSILTFPTKEKAKEESDKYLADTNPEGVSRETSTAIIDLLACYHGKNVGMSIMPITYAVELVTNNLSTK